MPGWDRTFSRPVRCTARGRPRTCAHQAPAEWSLERARPACRPASAPNCRAPSGGARVPDEVNGSVKEMEATALRRDAGCPHGSGRRFELASADGAPLAAGDPGHGRIARPRERPQLDARCRSRRGAPANGRLATRSWSTSSEGDRVVRNWSLQGRHATQDATARGPSADGARTHKSLSLYCAVTRMAQQRHQDASDERAGARLALAGRGRAARASGAARAASRSGRPPPSA